MHIRRWLSIFAFSALVVGGIAPASAYTVQRGDTVSGIAHSHGTTVTRLRHLNPRKLRNPDLIHPGEHLRTSGKVHRRHPHHPRVNGCNKRVWPVPGHLIYTYPGHDGVDINRGAGWDDFGDPIRSVSCGHVSYVGWNRGYGDAIFVRLPKGKEIVYGHTSSQYVHSGEHVRAGKLIGRVGSSGNSTAPHLHFGFPGGTFRQAMGYLLGGGAGGVGPVFHTRPKNAAQLATSDGIGLGAFGFGGRPRTHAPWSLNWDAIAQCESSGRWHVNTGNGFFGGLQFQLPTWYDFHGRQFAAFPHHASKRQQKIVAERVLHSVQGLGAWPVCGARGLL